MAQRRAHGAAARNGTLVVQEPKPFDELAKPDPVAAPHVPLAFREDGKIADSATARALGKRGNEKRWMFVRILRSIGLVELASDHPFYPYEVAGQEFADSYIGSLASMFDGYCGEGPASIVKTAGMQLAASRYLYDQGKQSGDTKLLGQASALGNDSRINEGAAYELQSREAEARKRPGSTANGHLPPGMVWVADKEAKK